MKSSAGGGGDRAGLRVVSALSVITIYDIKSLMLNLCAIQIQFLNAWSKDSLQVNV